MKTFNELFEEAVQISDKRTAVFNRLIEKTETEIIPAFAKMLNGYGLQRAFFTMYVCPFKGFISQNDDEDRECWPVAVNNSGCIDDCQKDFYIDKYSVYNAYERGSAKFTKVGIVPFVKLLNNRVEQLNKKYAAKIEEAEVLLK